jgi:delta14-sterol reductase
MTVYDAVLPVTADTLAFAAKLVMGFVGALFLGAILLPGIDREGYPMPTGGTRRYKLYGMTLFFLTHIAVGVGTLVYGWSLSPLITHFWSVFIVANVLAVVWTLALYVWGKRPGAVGLPQGEGVPLPRPVKDLWFGPELNPTWLGVDLKMFLYHPSLIGVGLYVVAFAYLQLEQTGTITPQMACFVAFWWAYLFTHYVKEEFMLSTWDILAENLGFMLVWGDLVYVPFLYALPGWWVAAETTAWSTGTTVAVVCVYALCLWVFRATNWQKERFKRFPDAPIWGKAPELVGGRLLASGFWGIGRKLNYTGEIGVYLAFSATAGLVHWGPWLVPLSLIILLTQRAGRDDKRCRAKYGAVWEEYCKRARFRMFPLVY